MLPLVPLLHKVLPVKAAVHMCRGRAAVVLMKMVDMIKNLLEEEQKKNPAGIQTGLVWYKPGGNF